MGAHRLAPDGGTLHASGDISVTKIAIDPVWHLPGIARASTSPSRALRRTLFEQTGGMFPGSRHAPRHAGLPAADPAA
jgi:hypothetical protein